MLDKIIIKNRWRKVFHVANICKNMENKVKRKIDKVLVVMSTYNGEIFVREQIDSILNQKGVEIVLMIRDDGSTDSTPQILNKYLEKYDNIIVIEGKNIGFRKSFFNTLTRDGRNIECDYFAFADQDDVWESNKIFHAVSTIKSSPCCGPHLFASGLNVVDANLNSMYNNCFPKLRISFGSALSRQRLAGCTMVFNKELYELCLLLDMDKLENSLISHDGAVYYICLLCGGKVSFDKNSLIKFRRHEGTVTEHGKGIMQRIYSITNIFGDTKNTRLKQAQSLYKIYKDYIPSDTKDFIENVIGYKKNVFRRFRLLCDNRIRCDLISIDIIYAFAVLLGCY